MRQTRLEHNHPHVGDSLAPLQLASVLAGVDKMLDGPLHPTSNVQQQVQAGEAKVQEV